MKHFILTSLFITILFSIESKTQETEKRVIGELQYQSHQDGCGCYFAFISGEKDVIQIETDTLVWMNVNGLEQ